VSTQAVPAQANPEPTPGFMRHALGMPAGSVRAMLAFAILGYLWVMALGTDSKGNGLLSQGEDTKVPATTAFIYLQLTMVLVLCHFVVAHGKSIGSRVSRSSPLWMPRGSVRVLLLAGYFGLAYWTYRFHPDYPKPNVELVIIVVALVLAAFLVGHLSTRVMHWFSGPVLPFWFLDVQAWFSLIALALLFYVLIGRLVINTSISPDARLTFQYSEAAMAAFVGFYFGARS
jgi:hypothetical protein